MPWELKTGIDGCTGTAVVDKGTTNIVPGGCHPSHTAAANHMAALYRNVKESAMPNTGTPAAVAAATAQRQAEAEMTSGSINDLPDSAFAYIEPGGKKDDQGKTTPRSKRHFPIHDAAHVRNALQRAGQSPFGDKALPKIRAAAKRLKIGKPAESAASNGRVELTSELVEAIGTAPIGRRFEVQLITPGWGTSGYYSPQVLSEAAAEKVFRAGTPMYIDHQTISESQDRIHGERSMKDLAARFVTDAMWNGTALVAQVESFGPWRPVLADMWSQIGVSIRSFGHVELGEAEGRQGMIVKKIEQAESVDFVAEAGRGGKVVALLEAARRLEEARSVGGWLEARVHSAFTEIADGMYGDGRLTRDERVALSSAIGEALTTFVSRLEAAQPQLYKRDPYQDPDRVTESAQTESAEPAQTDPDPAAAAPAPAEPPADSGISNPDPAPDQTPSTDEPPPADDATADEPPAEDSAAADEPSGDENPTPSEGDAEMPADGNSAAATEAAATPGSARQLMGRELAETRRERDLAVARERARVLITEGTRDAWVPPAMIVRITEAVLRDLPMVEADGQPATLDETEFSVRLTREIDQAESEATQILDAAGVGRPRDLGHFTESGFGGGNPPADLDTRLQGAFATLGLSESAAKIAARGRA